MHDVRLLAMGDGIAGSAAALRAAQYHVPTSLVRSDATTAKASRGCYVRNIDNMIGMHEGVLKEDFARNAAELSEEAGAHPSAGGSPGRAAGGEARGHRPGGR